MSGIFSLKLKFMFEEKNFFEQKELSATQELNNTAQMTQQVDNAILLEEKTEMETFKEYVELKKLQNRILAKIIDKLNSENNQSMSNNK